MAISRFSGCPWRVVGKGVIALMLAACACVAVLALAGCQKQAPTEVSNETETTPQQEALETSDVQKKGIDPAYVLIIGDDSWEKYTPGSSDMMMLMRVDFDQDQVTLVSIPRDTKYTLSDGSAIKVNGVYHNAGGGDEGAKAACEAASSITGVNVSDYLVVGFDGLQGIVEHFGGLDVDLPYALTYSFYTKDYPDEVYQAGEQTLTPWRAMALSRARTGYGDYGLSQDMMRQIVDRQMMVKLVSNLFANPAQAVPVMQELLGFVQTNISTDTLTEWAGDLLEADQITVFGTSGPVDGGIDEATGAWLVPEAPEKWKALMDVVDAGGDPSTVNAQFEENVQPDNAPINTKTVIDVGA